MRTLSVAGILVLAFAAAAEAKAKGTYRYSWFTSKTGTHEIALARPGSGFTNIYCDK